MSKTKKQTTASMDNIYTLDGKVPPAEIHSLWPAARSGNVCCQHCADHDRHRRKRPEHPGNGTPDPDCYDHGGHRHAGPAVHCVEAGRETAHRYGHQLYIRFCVLLCGSPVGL